MRSVGRTGWTHRVRRLIKSGAWGGLRVSFPIASKAALSYLMVAPAVLYLVLAIGLPVGLSLFNSFRHWKLTDPSSGIYFVGLRNYAAVLSNPLTWHSLVVTGKYVMLAVCLEVLLGLTVALLLAARLPGISALRTGIIMPMMIADVAGALSWRLLLDAQTGFWNYLWIRIGLAPRLWLGPALALYSIVLVDVWQQTPFVALILLASVQGLPPDLLEAARIDGASWWQELRHVVIPFLKPAILVAVTFRTIFALRVFAPVWVLTGGGPADRTLTIGLNIYRAAFRYYDMGIAGALSWVLVFATLLVALAFVRLLTREAMA